MSYWYRTRHQYELEPDEEPAANDDNERLPRTHAELNALAEARNHEWTTTTLTVAEKQAELGG